MGNVKGESNQPGSCDNLMKKGSTIQLMKMTIANSADYLQSVTARKWEGQVSYE